MFDQSAWMPHDLHFPESTVMLQPRIRTHRMKLMLDRDELFAQLCVSVKLVKPGPQRGLFEIVVNMSSAVLRLWRDWLEEQVDISQQDTGGETAGILWLNEQQDAAVRAEVTSGKRTSGSLISQHLSESAALAPTKDYTVECRGRNAFALC